MRAIIVTVLISCVVGFYVGLGGFEPQEASRNLFEQEEDPDLLMWNDDVDIVLVLEDPNCPTNLIFMGASTLNAEEAEASEISMWERKEYICDPNDTRYTDLMCDEIELHMEPDGNLYLRGGSLEDFAKCIYEVMVLKGNIFTGELIVENKQ